ncbi:Eco57I restriction-modification methylase domain-containing protein [Cloacibacillus porcorum]|uniref:Eco57I restriction-modification methylase domain-containing protein n=1 Tax=Cloacibacillus porcorum TaxID=1197717 RepID=UPI002A90A213|nr:TaqI-like C-terminal specificity domain-containing protein [Cloacibacillus porcorum]MDY5391083.1 TaqI-like C-terminal specificity domain-containing protein [Cloacibacillus porcorum]
MLGGGNSSVIQRSLSKEEFDSERFIIGIKPLFASINTTERWIRSGIHIPQELKNTISSYRLLGRHTPPEGQGRIDILQIKLAPGTQLAASEKKCVKFLMKHMESDGADAVFAAITSARGEGHLSLFIESTAVRGIVIPDDILDYLSTEGIKNFLHKSCGLAPAALDGYFSDSCILFDDTVFARDAKKLDAALASMRFCDIAAAGGELVGAFIKKIAAVRLGLGKYFSESQPRTEERFIREFIENSLFVTDCSAAALDILKTELKLKFPQAEIKDDRFVWGSILVDNIFTDVKFDLILTNPPHLRSEQFSSIKELLSGYSSSRFNADIYCYYVEKAVSMLSSRGSAVFLISNKWMKSDYGAGLRDFFQYHNPAVIADLGKVPLLKGTVMPLSVVSVLKEPESSGVKFINASARPKDTPLPEYAEECARPLSECKFSSASWSFPESGIAALVAGIRERGVPLSCCTDNKIYRGILTGLNEAFVISPETAEAISAEEPASAELIVPFYSGRDIKRYYLPPVKKYLIFMPKGYTDRRRELSDGYLWFAQNHPRLASHLARYEAKAAKRRDRGDYWWELRPCRYYEVFQRQKILLPVICRGISAVLDEGGAYANDKCCIIDSGDCFLLALLNSRLMSFIFRSVSAPLMNDYFELRPSTLAELPVRGMNPANASQRRLRAEITAYGEKLSRIYTLNPPAKYGRPDGETLQTEKELNRAVYRLYGLTPAEINIVENN